MKIIKTIIEKCLHCDYCIDEQFLTGMAKHYKDNNGKCHSYLVCNKNDNKRIVDENSIPSWCPLEDYKDEDNNDQKM